MAIGLTACIEIPNPYTALPPGTWRATLKLVPVPVIPNPKGAPIPEKVGLEFEEVTEGALPFNFDVVYTSETDFHILIKNGPEEIKVDDITIGLDRATGKDTVVINFPVFDSYIKAIYEENVMEGQWVVNNRANYSIPFVAKHGKNHRFTTLRKPPMMDITGKWQVQIFEDDEVVPAIGEFQQEANGNQIVGTFQTETGDYRFLEGTIQDNKVYLSCFDGAHAFLFEAKIREDSSMVGSFRSGKHYRSTWEAKRNDQASLKDPDELTYLKEGYDQFEFSFPNTEGKMVSLDDPQFEGKVKIVQIFGTWCPNCRDETNFLKSYLEEHNSPDLAVIGLAFEKYRAQDKAVERIKTFKNQIGIDYEILAAGYYNKKEAAQALPMLNAVIAYPTLLFLDRNNQVRKIHTGFSGPATSNYDSYQEEFHEFLTQLLAEN